MAYEPTEWKAGDVITGSKMNKIEAQLAANTEEIESVIPQENLFALTKSVEGYINTDGGVSVPGAQTQERVSEYIAVTPGDAMAYQCWVNVPAGSIPWAAYCFYNSDRAKTGSVVAVTDATSTASDGSKYIAQAFTVPSGAAYIRVSFRTFGAARAKLEVGSTPTLYVVNKHDYLALQQIGAEAGGLKSAINDKLDALISYDFSTKNKRINITNGEPVTSNGCKITDFVPCSAGINVKWYGQSFWYQNHASMYCVAFYNASKQLISGVTQVDGSAATTSQEGTISVTAPENTAYVRGSCNSGVDDPYLNVFNVNINAIKTESHEAYQNLPIAQQLIVSPVLANGSGGNPANANGVTARALPLHDAEYIVVKNTRPVSASGNYYVYDISAFKGAAWYTNRITGLHADERGTLIFDSAKVINGISGVDGFGVTIWEYNSSDVLQTLRIGDFTNGDLIVRYVYDENVQTNREVINDFVQHNLLQARHVPGLTRTPLTLLHFSDIHADANSLKRIIKDANQYAQYIDGKICTGDIVANTAGEITSWWDKDVMTCIGNHDSASYADGAYNWTALSMADRDAYYIAPFESNWGITHTSGKSYYYKDYATQKVRLIVMDVMLYNNAGQDATDQTTWLTGLMSDAITNDYHVIIAIHCPHGGSTPVESSFTKYGAVTFPTYADCNVPQTVIDAVATAITGGLHFVGYIVGHTHQDGIWDAEGDDSQLMYCVTCAVSGSSAQWKNSDQYRSKDFDAYNLVSIDTSRTLVKLIRGGGADIDNLMRQRKAICFNYSTGEKVGEIL